VPFRLPRPRHPTYSRFQKRREQRYDSARQLDILSGLNLGPSEDEDEDSLEPPQIIHEGISQFASLLSPEAPPPLKTPDNQPPHSAQADNVPGAIAGGHVQVRQSDHQTNDVEQTSLQPSSTRTKKKKKAKRRQKPQPSSAPAEPPQNPTPPKASGQKRNQWADRCMYAELLELNPGPALNPQIDVEDGLPDDLDTDAWVAISGVPLGKRCLAVTYASSGIAGTGANPPVV
jgi:snurportin-1